MAELAWNGMDDRLIRLGVLTPHTAPGPEAEFPIMAPGRITIQVERVPADAAGITTSSGPPSLVAARRLTGRVLDKAADPLGSDSVDAIGYASTSTAYLLGPDHEAAMVARLRRRTGAPVAATCAAAVLALRVLNVQRVALVAPPWFDAQLNELGAAYFRSQGLRVVSSASADLPSDPERIQPSAVYDWISRYVDGDADAVFIGGNGFRSVEAIMPLEEALGGPVLASNQVLLWSLLAQSGATFEVRGFGRLFTLRLPVDG